MKTKSFRGAALAASAVMGCVGAALAAVAQAPLLTTSSAVPPNLMFTLDDSGSMYFECLPDALCVSGGNRVGTIPGGTTGAGGLKSGVASYGSVFGARMRAAAINPLYYNPGTRYQPWLQADNTRKAQYPGTAAPVDPRNPGGATMNLAVAATMSLSWCDAANACTTAARSFYPAQYFNLNTGAAGIALSDFTEVTIQSGGSYPKAPTRTDCAGPTSCSYAEEMQNFSNWYTYARSRMLVAIGGTSEAFSDVPTNYRVGYGTINTVNQAVDDFATNTVARGVRPFSGLDRDDFYTRLQTAVPNGGTPLRRAMNDVGQYFSRVDKKGPWSDTPGTLSARADLSCRRSFHLLMTDGVWNGDGASTVEATADVDSTSGPLITGPDGQSFQYSPTKPYAGDGGNTLADIAMHYWSRDLHGGLENGVAASAANPAFWQHMVNYTIAFGVNGNLANPGDLPALTAGSKTWGMPVADAGAVNVDDLWHAAINSRGKSLSATNSAEYAAAVKSMLDDIAARSSSEAGVAVSGLAGTAATRKYVPGYSTDKWSGELSAVKLVDGSTAWKASTMLPAPTSRNIYTFATSIPYRRPASCYFTHCE
ncbi:MAG: hypothetical protein EOO27_21175 [Comamonadaceae bacterium]|nr:MAG: hypothetical protein EOO27_21175 [Comamonadaceae bacterium]